MKLEFVGLTKKYRKKIALNSFSMELENGIYALLGPNGAGKSTLMNMLACLLEPTEGQIKLDGEDIRKMGAEYRAILGYLPQNLGLYKSYTGKQTLKYYAKLRDVTDSNRIDKLLEQVNLSDMADVKVGKYSGGMKRRLGIALALLNDPKILIFDEPTNGLDPKERVQFRKLLSELSHDKIIIIATHIVPDVESIADSCILLNRGEIAIVGSPELLIHDTGEENLEGVYMHYFGDEVGAQAND